MINSILEGEDINTQEPNVENITNVETLITKGDAQYHIFWGTHVNPRQININPNTSALLLEQGTDQYPTNYYDFINTEFPHSNQTPMLEYVQTKRNLPFYIVDSNFKPITILTEALIVSGISIAGIFPAEDALKNIFRKKPINRREFLKSSAKALTSLWLATPTIDGLISLTEGLLPATPHYQPSNIIHDTAQTLRPDAKLLTLHVRDLITAQKMEFITNRLGHKYISQTRGTGHKSTLTEYLLQSEEDRLKKLEFLAPIIKQTTIKETFSQIPEYNWVQSPDTFNLHFHTEPRLKELESKIFD